MRKITKQINLFNLQFIVALFFILDFVIGAKIDDKTTETNQLNQNHLDTASILSNYHSDAEQITRDDTNFENKSTQEKTANTLNGQLKNAKYDTQLKIVKRSARNYNFGLGKRDKPQQLTDEQVKEFLNYLYNIDFNLILNYIYGLNEDDTKQTPSTLKLTSNFESDLDDDELDTDSLILNDKYKSKRDTQNRLNRYAFGLGKKKRSLRTQKYNFGVGKRFGTNLGYPYGNSRLDEYMKRRYSFGIGKRSAE